jgi:hypothetical protein
MMGLHNFSSTAFPLIPDRKLIVARFYRLATGELRGEYVRPKSLFDFPDERISAMAKCEPVALQSLTAGVSPPVL